jgi:hypothetical protein
MTKSYDGRLGSSQGMPRQDKSLEGWQMTIMWIDFWGGVACLAQAQAEQETFFPMCDNQAWRQSMLVLDLQTVGMRGSRRDANVREMKDQQSEEGSTSDR